MPSKIVALKKDLSKLGIKVYKHKKTKASFVKKSDVKKVIASLQKSEGAFMKPEVYKGKAYVVDTPQGMQIIPHDVVGNINGMKLGDVFDEDNGEEFEEVVESLKDYIEGDEIFEVEFSEGWLARMSASGYQDATDWGIYKSEQEARDHLEEMYDD